MRYRRGRKVAVARCVQFKKKMDDLLVHQACLCVFLDAKATSRIVSRRGETGVAAGGEASGS